jgi:hypothetical protein
VSRVAALDVPGGQINLTNNAMVVDYVSTSPIANVKSLIASGYAGGSWTGEGITSSQANASTFALGYANATAINTTSFLGQTVGNSVLIRFTEYGDANLDGVVNALDFNAFASHYAAIGKFWSDGDFNYDGTVNSLDFNSLATEFGSSLPAPSPAIGALVPEPGVAGLAAIAMVWFAKRSQRRGPRGPFALEGW